jgi:hypothetical protein
VADVWMSDWHRAGRNAGCPSFVPHKVLSLIVRYCWLAVKSAANFRSGFERIADSIHNIDAQALHTHDFARLDYRHRRRPMFPLEPC